MAGKDGGSSAATGNDGSTAAAKHGSESAIVMVGHDVSTSEMYDKGSSTGTIVEKGYSTSCQGIFAIIPFTLGMFGSLGNELISYEHDARSEKEL